VADTGYISPSTTGGDAAGTLNLDIKDENEKKAEENGSKPAAKQAIQVPPTTAPAPAVAPAASSTGKPNAASVKPMTNTTSSPAGGSTGAKPTGK
jgi:hypothetical protein